jgi:hypothetical protein
MAALPAGLIASAFIPGALPLGCWTCGSKRRNWWWECFESSGGNPAEALCVNKFRTSHERR